MNGFPKRASNPSRSSGRPEVVLDLPTVSKMLPLVQRIVADLLSAEQQLGALLWEQEGLDRDRRNLGWPERQRRYHVQDEVSRLEQKRRDATLELEALGVKVVDAAHGRVGFPTIVNTKAAFFSWQPGDENVRYWHFASDNAKRRPIPAGWLTETPLAAFKRK
jgi:hypothetical protein